MPRRVLRRCPCVRTSHGTVAVEFAVILPILLMLLFGVTTAGLSLTNAIGLSNAVREGARFGATDHPGGASLPFTGAEWDTWANDTIARVRGTQFDDSSGATAVCVDMYKVGSGPIGASAKCHQGNGSVSPPLDATKAPAVSTSQIAADTCVVRVWSARPFEINLVVAPIQAGYIRRSSVTRYELRMTEACP